MIKSQNTSSHGALRALLSGLLYAILMILTFPPFSFWGLVFLVPIPLYLAVLRRKARPVLVGLYAAIGTLPAWLWTHFWIRDISAFGLIPLVIVLALFPFLFVWLGARVVSRFDRALLTLPLIWVGIEFFRGVVFATGYPWYLLAHPLIESPSSVLAMPASWGGVYFVSFLAASYSMLLLQTVMARPYRRRLRIGIAAAGLFASWIFAGLLMISQPPQEPRPFRFALIQPDVPQDNRLAWTTRQRWRDWLTLKRLTIEAATDPKNPMPLDVIIWPEGFVPGWTLDPISLDTERSERLAWDMTPRSPDDVPDLPPMPSQISATRVVDDLLELQRTLDTPMLVGSVAFDHLQIVDTDQGIEYKRDAMYNSAFVILNARVQPVWYDKLHLTPFGEVMPYISSSPWLEKQLLSFGAQGMEFALSPGKAPVTLRVPYDGSSDHEMGLATPICFEATIPAVCRRLVFSHGSRQAGLLVNMTNDGWFGDSDAAREEHLQLARWRCIELATPMLRCANTGFSSLIDSNGQVLNRTITSISDNPREGYLIDQVRPGTRTTLYARVGDLFGWLVFILTMIWVGAAIFPRREPVEIQTETEI